MLIRKLEIFRFRGIRQGEVLFPDRALLVGENNAGKSTVCEALELVLGPERLNRRPVVDEHDFFEGEYLTTDKEQVEIRIAAVLIRLPEEAESRLKLHLRRWNDKTLEFCDEAVKNGASDADSPDACWALPVEFIGRYDPVDDDFEGNTFFSHPQVEVDEDDVENVGRLGAGLTPFRRDEKRLCGFVFLRTLRTGSRALSFQRGSLLDTILRLGGEGFEELWEDTLSRLRNLDPAIGQISQLQKIQAAIAERIQKFIPLDSEEATAFFASDLTRVHLRETVRFFAASERSGHLVPFNRLGTGTVNMLVFALLTFIAELKGEQRAIFAMEEPEIALPPHTQRRVTQFVLKEMGQAIITSHSPYVIEQFDPADIVILERVGEGVLKGTPVVTTEVKLKSMRSARRQFAEAILSRAVLVVEGGTELIAMPAIADALERFRGADGYTHPDLSGLTFFDANGDSNVPRYGPLFKALGKRTYSLCDKQKKEPTEGAAAQLAAYEKHWESDYGSVEELLVEEIPPSVLRRFLNGIAGREDYPQVAKCQDADADDDVKELARTVLSARKNSEPYAAGLISHCQSEDELPESLVTVLEHIHTALSPPIMPVGQLELET